ncbi:hypothetical protein BDA99DRAFT_541735 [Phascolomyces articulosus]|uniref:Uncharacterized protein n=1 Tax=Phascolomyces articulosus TaxID=60185 RepID=A0AAD5K0N8_9FUNG|nr:hypothetical protein BDA99DRAFT_541735 [Phascolomyces articulosus]
MLIHRGKSMNQQQILIYGKVFTITNESRCKTFQEKEQLYNTDVVSLKVFIYDGVFSSSNNGYSSIASRRTLISSKIHSQIYKLDITFTVPGDNIHLEEDANNTLKGSMSEDEEVKKEDWSYNDTLNSYSNAYGHDFLRQLIEDAMNTKKSKNLEVQRTPRFTTVSGKLTGSNVNQGSSVNPNNGDRMTIGTMNNSNIPQQTFVWSQFMQLEPVQITIFSDHTI